MTLTEQLLKADDKKAKELKKGTFLSERLAGVLEQDDPVAVEIREIPVRRLQEISSRNYDRKGNRNMDKAFDNMLLIVCEGCVSPDLRNEDLQRHFGAHSPADLAEILFGAEGTDLSIAIQELSGVKFDGDEEDEVKN